MSVLALVLVLISICLFLAAIATHGDGYRLMMLVSWLLRRYATFKDQPVFDTSNIEWCRTLRNSHDIITDEYTKYSAHNYTPANCEVDPLPQPLISQRAHWRVAILRLFYRDTALAKHFPRTMALIKSLPVQPPFVMISILEPGAGLAPHVGYYKGVLRYHLGLSVPENSSSLHEISGRPLCHLRVASHTHVWQRGQDLLFDDCYEHEVQNHTNSVRVILLIDIPRSFDQQWANWLNRGVLHAARVNDTTHVFINNVNKFDRRQRSAATSSSSAVESAHRVVDASSPSASSDCKEL